MIRGQDDFNHREGHGIRRRDNHRHGLRRRFCERLRILACEAGAEAAEQQQQHEADRPAPANRHRAIAENGGGWFHGDGFLN